MSYFMSSWLNIGLLTSYAFIAYILIKWGNIRCIGVTPLRTPVFMAILFTSGLEVGGIMLPLIDFPVFEDTLANPEYRFTNPLAMEFASMGFAIWSGYFMMCFYFCVIFCLLCKGFMQTRSKHFDMDSPAVTQSQHDLLHVGNFLFKLRSGRTTRPRSTVFPACL